MKVLITGANGFLGHYLAEKLLDGGYNVMATGKGDCRLPFTARKNFSYAGMDFADPFSVDAVFAGYRPEVVVHAGAMSKPDDCELDQWKAYVINVEGTLNTLANAGEQKSFFIYISTDFVFDGEKGNYEESDLCAPVNFYGKTKLLAEEATGEYSFEKAIVRTALVYGKNYAGRDNLLTLVKKKLENNEAYSVFEDQSRTPTYVEDLAEGIVAIIQKRATGVYHISGKDILTPYEMACAVADHLNLDASLIKPVTAKDFIQPAKRPGKTNFIIEKAKRELNFNPRSFGEGLKKTFGT
jgi:dTDP-4-dehydrorhamnose reductase